MTIEKVYDELYGMIEDLKRQIAAAGGGDDVTITPALESGTKIADYTIGETEGSLYAPVDVYLNIDDTAEHIVGKYKGSDLYCKRINIDAFPASAFTQTSYPHGIANIDELIDYDVFTQSNTGQILKLFYVGILSNGVDSTSFYSASVDKTNIYITTGRDRSGVSGYAILYYTKTPPVESKKTIKKK